MTTQLRLVEVVVVVVVVVVVMTEVEPAPETSCMLGVLQKMRNLTVTNHCQRHFENQGIG